MKDNNNKKREMQIWWFDEKTDLKLGIITIIAFIGILCAVIFTNSERVEQLEDWLFMVKCYIEQITQVIRIYFNI